MPNMSNLSIWEKKSSIRSRPRRILEVNEKNPYFFPINEQPLCIHPLITSRRDSVIHYILIQSAYKFMGNIACIETAVVNNLANKIVNQNIAITFPASLRADLLTVIIDEAYHAYVATDFMNQLEEITGIAPIEPVRDTSLSYAIKLVGDKLPLPQRDFFEIVAVCIGENSITKDLVDIKKDERVNKFFNEVNADHAIDEGRHCGIFAQILTYLWENIIEEDKDMISDVVPTFIYEYLKPDFQREYNKKILASLELSAKDIEQVIHDTHVNYTQENFRLVNPIVINIQKLFEKTGVFNHSKMYANFQAQGLM